MPELLVYVVDPDRCKVIVCDPQTAAESRLRIHLTERTAALFAYHLAGEKLNHWAEVKNEAWASYVKKSERVTI